MNRELFIQSVIRCFESSEYNIISKEQALSDELVSVRIFDHPIVAVADAFDADLEGLQKNEVVGEHFMLPVQWLPNAKSVISIFFPFTQTIRSGNKEDMSYPSNGWLNGRIEGQYFINEFSADIVGFLNDSGFASVAPSIDKRFFANMDNDNNGINKTYTSNWSERHVAHVCGLGTFSLSKGLITEKGIAGRFTSIITELSLVPDEKTFGRFDENCIMCGKCIKNCPVNAISFEHGKNHEICSAFLNEIMAKHSPWYGCGKCQVDVPCEYRNPRQQALFT